MTKIEAQNYVFKQLEHVLPRLAVDPYLFPDQKLAKEVFSILDMENVVRGIDARKKEREQNERIAKFWKSASPE